MYSPLLAHSLPGVEFCFQLWAQLSQPLRSSSVPTSGVWRCGGNPIQQREKIPAKNKDSCEIPKLQCCPAHSFNFLVCYQSIFSLPGPHLQLPIQPPPSLSVFFTWFPCICSQHHYNELGPFRLQQWRSYYDIFLITHQPLPVNVVLGWPLAKVRSKSIVRLKYFSKHHGTEFCEN